MRYPPAIESALSGAGWTPDRRVDIDAWTTALTSEGYTLSKVAAQTLSNLGGLKVHLPANPPRNPYSHDLIFDPLFAGSGDRDKVEDWEQCLGCQLFPVGYVTKAYPVWIAENGAVYHGLDFGLYPLGESFAEALRRLLSGDIDQTPVIP